MKDRSRGKKLGQGGFAKIYESEFNGEKCAIKYADKKNNSRRYLRREMRILNHLKNCKYVVKVLDYKISRSGYIKYELLEEELLDYMYVKNTFEHRENIIKQLREAILELHNHGVMHCDIKPENIMIDKFGTLKFIDFGHAVFFDEIKDNIICIGTIPYRCPEYILGSSIDHSADYWSIGCVILEMFYGDTVFIDKRDNGVTPHGYMLGLIIKIFGNIHPDLINGGEWSEDYYDMKTRIYLHEYLLGKPSSINNFIKKYPEPEREFYEENITDFFYKDLLSDRYIKRFAELPRR